MPNAEAEVLGQGRGVETQEQLAEEQRGLRQPEGLREVPAATDLLEEARRLDCRRAHKPIREQP